MIPWAKVDKGIEVIRTLVPLIRAWRQKRREAKAGAAREAHHDPVAQAIARERAEANKKFGARQ